VVEGSAQRKNFDDDYLMQTVSLSVSNKSFDKVLDILSSQLHCYFTYDAVQIDGERLVSINCQNCPLKNVLDTLLNNPLYNYQVVNNQVVIHPVHDSDKTHTQTQKTMHKISGIVMDKMSQKPLPFASIALKGSYLGAITNQNGSFIFKIPNAHSNDTLQFSYMGYYNCELPLSDFPENGQVKLEEALVSIQEVIVRSKDPYFIVDKAIEAISENYASQSYLYEAFYREAIQNNKRYMFYSEALVQGSKPALRRAYASDKVVVEKARRFTNIQQSDTFLVKLRGGMDACFQLDIIRHFPDFLSHSRKDLYHFQLSDIIIWHNQLVYVIAFKQKSNIDEALLEGVLYIETQNYALVGADFYFSQQQLKRSDKLFVVRKSKAVRVTPVKTNYSVRYVKIKGQYYIQHVRGELELKVRKRPSLFAKNFLALMEMFYTNYELENQQKPERSKLFKTSSVFSDAAIIYETGFWLQETIIEPEENIFEAFKKSGFKKLEEKLLETE
jgi:Tfp pilus assembly protein PilZ